MQDENRCLKFTGYIYLPDSDADHKILRKHSAKTMGRIMIYDEKNNPKLNRMEAFDNVGTMLDVIMTEFKKRVLKRVPTKKK